MAKKVRLARHEQRFKNLRVMGDHVSFFHNYRTHWLKVYTGAKDKYRTGKYFVYNGKRYYV